MVIREWYKSRGEVERGDGWSRWGWCVSYDVDDAWRFWALDVVFNRERDAEHALAYLTASKITAEDYHQLSISEQRAIDRDVCRNCIAW